VGSTPIAPLAIVYAACSGLPSFIAQQAATIETTLTVSASGQVGATKGNRLLLAYYTPQQEDVVMKVLL
jgi:hypothetical protein